MSAEVLRKAARLMRQRAEIAKPGPWSYLCSTGAGTGEAVVTYASHDLESSLTVECGPDGGAEFDCEHFASWHPAVAIAVADWLDQHADYAQSLGREPGPRPLAVATTYLGGAS